MLDQVTRRERRGVLKIGDQEGHDDSIVGPQIESRHSVKSLGLHANDDTDERGSCLPRIGFDCIHPDSERDPPDNEHAQGNQEEPPTALIHLRGQPCAVETPVPVLPGAYSGIPSAHSGQVAGPGS